MALSPCRRSNVEPVEELSCVCAFGAGNEEPRFAVVDARSSKPTSSGSGHVALHLTGRGGAGVKRSHSTPRIPTSASRCCGLADSRVHLAGTVRADTWQDERTPSS